jgi:hypothetical protein
MQLLRRERPMQGRMERGKSSDKTAQGNQTQEI